MTRREKVFNKTNGMCAYCGILLQKGWHVDEVMPIKRVEGLRGVCRYPNRYTIDNQLASCPRCNINKGSYSLQWFRVNYFTLTTQFYFEKIGLNIEIEQEKSKPRGFLTIREIMRGGRRLES